MAPANPVPEGWPETLMEAGLHLPGPLGFAFQKRLKARYMERSRLRFDNLLERVGPADICVDLGANVGSFTSLFARTGATVHAFEPDPETFDQLQKNVGQMKNVHFYQAAVSAFDGDVELYRAKEYEKDKVSKSLGASIARPDRWAMNLKSPILVQSVDCLGFLAKLPKPPAIVKMDIEGAEWDILEALVQGKGRGLFDHMFVETHERFSPWSLMPKLRRMREYFSTPDAPYVNLYWQ